MTEGFIKHRKINAQLGWILCCDSVSQNNLFAKKNTFHTIFSIKFTIAMLKLFEEMFILVYM